MCYNNSLGGYSFGYTTDGKLGYREAGADTVFPFSSNKINLVSTNRSTVVNKGKYLIMTISQEHVSWNDGYQNPVYPGSSLTINGINHTWDGNCLNYYYSPPFFIAGVVRYAIVIIDEDDTTITATPHAGLLPGVLVFEIG